MLTDLEYMERALDLAERGRGTTSPNPMVGAVIVAADGTIVGQGFHEKAGGPHAEIRALDEAGDLAKGASLYCTWSMDRELRRVQRSWTSCDT